MLGPRLSFRLTVILSAVMAIYGTATPGSCRRDDRPGVSFRMEHGGLLWMIYRPVYQLGDWIWNYYQRALQMLQKPAACVST